MALILTENRKLYRNAGTHENPVWKEIATVTKLTLNATRDESVLTRSGIDPRKNVDGTKEE